MSARRLSRYRSPRRRGFDPYDNVARPLGGYFYRRLDAALELAELDRRDTAVDLGCWLGHLLVSVAPRVRRVVGIDVGEERAAAPAFDTRVAGRSCLWIARELLTTELGTFPANCALVQADLRRPPLAPGCADVVFCLDALEHVADPDAAFDAITKLLAPRGRLVVALPIELGPALVLRQLAGWLFSFRREPYSARELLRTVLAGRTPVTRPRGGQHHAGYDWRDDLRRLGARLDVDAIRFVPMPALGAWNPTVLIRARSRAHDATPGDAAAGGGVQE